MATRLKEFSPKLLSQDQIATVAMFKKTEEYQLLRAKAEEFRKNGDQSAGVFIVQDRVLKSSVDVMLYWGLQRRRMRDGTKPLLYDQSPFWISKGVGFALNGYSSSEWIYTSPVRGLKLDDHYNYPKERSYLRRRLTPVEKLDFGVNVAEYYRDYRFGNGLISLLGLRYFGRNVITVP